LSRLAGSNDACAQNYQEQDHYCRHGGQPPHAAEVEMPRDWLPRRRHRSLGCQGLAQLDLGLRALRF
jgi:hypothetical protein